MLAAEANNVKFNWLKVSFCLFTSPKGFLHPYCIWFTFKAITRYCAIKITKWDTGS
jgi:hypothetical protein